jgi:hypothetical protein
MEIGYFCVSLALALATTIPPLVRKGINATIMREWVSRLNPTPMHMYVVQPSRLQVDWVWTPIMAHAGSSLIHLNERLPGNGQHF